MEEEYHHAAFHIGFITTMYFIPLTVIVGLYLMILQRLWSQSAPGGTRSAESLRGKKRVTRMVVIVVVTFIICWLPIQVVLLLKSLDMYDMTTFKVFVQIFGQVLAYMNSCINPILYAFLSEPFRKAFRKVISCGPNRKSTNGRIAYEGAQNSRTADHQRQSIVFTNLQETIKPNNKRGTKEKKDYDEENGSPGNSECHLKLMANQTTTTSFINGSTNEESPSCSRKMLNCV
ncbi:Allatostatin-A receptor [Armadillidium nasatum]|uniref:Allatostatin-A receptor n=1 Tax=Armadillidium nasatum TaxID=96803 RepID=A0A5N5TLQ4_9CRUS|nr:Allatostatin-A receptor [Armadillidium nasatum]